MVVNIKDGDKGFIPSNIYKLGLKLPDLSSHVLQAFPNAFKLISEGRCPMCKQLITKFVDQKSMDEYGISGLCNRYQYQVF